MEGADPGYQGLAAADIALQETVHRQVAVQILADLLEAGKLVTCQREGQALDAGKLKAGGDACSTRLASLFQPLVTACNQLQVEELGEGKGFACLFQCLQTGGIVVETNCLVSIQKVIALLEVWGKLIGKLGYLGEDCLDVCTYETLAERTA